MRKHFIVAALFLISIASAAQSDTSGIIMRIEYGSKNNEVADLLRFQNIDYYKAEFVGENLRAKYFSVLVKEMWDGQLKKTDTLINSKTTKNIGAVGSDTLTLTLLGSKSDKNS